MSASDIDIQRRYYAETAHRYNEMHVREGDEHYFALSFMMAAIDHCGIRSILDIGAGTGRTLHYVRRHRPAVRIVGIEPVAELRAVGHAQGIPADTLIEGDALGLRFVDGEFDLVCEFGVLHHIPTPEAAVREMLRVAGKAIFISDSNNFGQGSAAARTAKQMLNMFGLWKPFDFLKTGGKGYTISDGDGLGYSYSVFNSYRQIQRACRNVHVLNTANGGINPYRTATHVALLGVK